jgi:hypothetical protein
MGPSGVRFAVNLRTWRSRRRLSTSQLSARLDRLGWPIVDTGITKIEGEGRRTDIDDAAAIALALDVSLAALLMPEPVTPVYGPQPRVEVTPGQLVSFTDAWAWASGERDLPVMEPPLRESEYVVANKPHRFRIQATGPGADAMRDVIAEMIGNGATVDQIRDAFEQSLVAVLREVRNGLGS